ncbi:AAA family ATPase [Naasia sp. SYSU D00948]|uniref:AAA family ATPase n=1 Tax=Naasia sp. SYSU D00948 TaxID=2817379 RepID=UPI001B300A3D|nr:AAA family ATPase [Naasia sp. SYSU D00948]
MSILLVSRSSSYASRLDGALGGSVITVAGSSLETGNDSGLDGLDGSRLDAAFVAPVSAAERPTTAISVLRRRFPRVPIVLVHENAVAGTWARSMGADAALRPDASDAEIAGLVDLLRSGALPPETALPEPWSGQWGYEHLEVEPAPAKHAPAAPRHEDAPAAPRQEDAPAAPRQEDAPAPLTPVDAPASPAAVETPPPGEEEPDAPEPDGPSGTASADEGSVALSAEAVGGEPGEAPDASWSPIDGQGEEETAPPAPFDLPAPTGASQVIAVVSPKGGLGKTTIATNLAVGLARVAPDSVVLVDGDLQFGDVAAVLNLTPSHTLPDMVTGLATRDSVVLKTLLTPHPTGLFVVCGSSSPADGERVTAEQFAHLIGQLSSVFRYVIIDTSPGLGEHALTALDQATDAVVVSGLTVPALRAVRTELALLESIGSMPAGRHVVLNMVDRKWGLRRQDAENITGARMDALIPRSDAVPFSINRGVPLLESGSKDPAARALVELLGRVFGAGDRRLLRPDRKKVAA